MNDKSQTVGFKSTLMDVCNVQ